MAVEASIVVSFSDDANAAGTVVVEIDPEHSNNLQEDSNGEMQLKSTFDATLPDSPVILLHHSADLKVGSTVVTEGTLTDNGSPGSQSRETEVVFAKVGDTAGLGYNAVPASSISVDWYGVLSGTFDVVGNDMKLLTGGPCVGIATFPVTFQKQYTLTPPSNMELDSEGNTKITIFIFMEAA
ncbi:MAG: hypothetical protein GY797_18230 [Deltaproteobacteria bacterium]|nr:hypothetical protein [Deltaproteobacteria bacterium]